MYVDDIIITGSNAKYLQHLIAKLNDVFTLEDLGELHYFFWELK